MANPRVIWLPKFDPSAEYIVVRSANPIAGRKYKRDETFDKSSVDTPRMRRLYESRIIAAVRSDDEQQLLDQDNRRQSKGKSFGDAKNVPQFMSDRNVERKAQMAPYIPKAMTEHSTKTITQRRFVEEIKEKPPIRPTSVRKNRFDE